MSEHEQEPSEGVRITDRRRIDPVTFRPRHPQAPTGAAVPPPAGGGGPAGGGEGAAGAGSRAAAEGDPGAGAGAGDAASVGAATGTAVPGDEAELPAGEQAAEQQALAEANARAEEALADVKRIAAEYANYRRRVDRDRELQRDIAIGTVIADLLPILDDVERARAHDELAGGFKSVGEALEGVAAKFGLERFGEPGVVFDPAEHEAMTSEHSDQVAEPTVTAVYQIGYRLRGRLLRPALVAVADNG